MDTSIRVFLCSTFTDLADERKNVLEAIRKLQLEHDSMEFFGARTKLPIKTCLEEVRKSDVLVVVVGHRYGNLVPGRGISFSEAEYREGHRLRRPCLVYFRDENIPVLPKHVERDSEKSALLEKWKERLSKRHTIGNFNSASDLALQVAADLSRTLRTLNEEREKTQRASMEEISVAVARTEQLREAMNDLERSYDFTLEALGDALDLKDGESGGHSKRVTAFTIAIARVMGLSKDKIRVIARGAFLHDIGKMAIPDAILQKRGALTIEEAEVMRQHTLHGYRMIRKIPFLSEAAEIVYTHQERFDGSGYPQGLKGSKIPMASRIFAIADTLDAITSDRPYRAARTISVARNEIEKLSGTHFDPDIVRVFMEMPPTIWEDLTDEINSQRLHFSYPLNVVPPIAAPERKTEKEKQNVKCPFCGNKINSD